MLFALDDLTTDLMILYTNLVFGWMLLIFDLALAVKSPPENMLGVLSVHLFFQNCNVGKVDT